MRPTFLVLPTVALVACAGAGLPPEDVSAPTPSAAPIAVLGAPSASASAAPAATPVADRYRDVSAKIWARAAQSHRAWERLRELTDRVGHRLSGSPATASAEAWGKRQLEAAGASNVRLEPVKVPHWERGAERGEIVRPERHALRLLALGGSVGTPRGGVRAPVLVVQSFAELERRAAEAKGKIVLFDVPLPAPDAAGPHYGEVVVYRGKGASSAARHGAVAVLVRSVTARSLRSPHTGALHYEEGVEKIPAAAISTEDSALLARLAAAGQVPEVSLELGAKELPDADAHNVIGELPGSTSPGEVVVIGGHLDSWDVGQGAHDDGAGVAMSIEALAVLRDLGLTPRRTLRVVLWANEENGLRGAKGYADAHRSELHVAGIEADTGAYRPIGLYAEADAPVLRDVVSLLAPHDAARVIVGHSGADVSPLVAQGMPGLGLAMDISTYFDVHHSDADTLDQVDPDLLAQDVAALATVAYVLADARETLPRAPVAPAAAH